MNKILHSLIALLFLLTNASISRAGESAREGTTVLLSPSEIADLKQWVENAKEELTLLQDEVRHVDLEKKRKMLIDGFEAVVGKSDRKENELLMRYTLNRALEINDLVGPHPEPSELQSTVSFLESTIELSKGFFTDDQKYLEAIGRGDAPQLQTPMALFAYQYSEMISQFSRTFLRPTLEYKVTYKALGWIANDLNSPRNLLRIQFAETINRVARLQAKYPAEPQGDDQQILQNIRIFKWEYRERVTKHIVTVNHDIKDALEAAERKRQDDARLAGLKEEERKLEIQRIETERIMADRQAKESEKLRAEELFDISYFSSSEPRSLQIVEATFAGNTNQSLRGNLTTHLREICNGQDYCSENLQNRAYGDPAPGAFKDFEIIYKCSARDHERRYYIPTGREMNAHGLSFDIDCFHRTNGSMMIRRATWGTGNQQLDVTALVRKGCPAAQDCTFQFNGNELGDPLPGIFKKLRIEYACDINNESAVFEAELRNPVTAFMSCRIAAEQMQRK